MLIYRQGLKDEDLNLRGGNAKTAATPIPRFTFLR
jgi:hypothetical protein